MTMECLKKPSGWPRRALALAVTLGLVLAGCDGASPTAPTGGPQVHEWIEETRTFPPLHGVGLHLWGALRVRQGAEARLEIVTDRALMPLVRTSVQGGILEISMPPEQDIHPSRPMPLELTLQTLESVELSSDGTIEGADLEAVRLRLSSTGAGVLDFENLRASQLDVEGEGWGGIYLSGRVVDQEVRLGGSSRYVAEHLESSAARIWILGSGSATVRVRDRLEVTIVGSGSVYYYGDPALESSITGTGRVERLGG